jgi:hypothetical protein
MAAASPPSVAARSSSDRRRIVRSRLFVASSFIFGLVALGRGDATERQALRQVVRACVADYQTTGASFSCLAVNLSDGIDRGSVVLRPPFGATDAILAPTRKVVGVEDPWLRSPTAPNCFAAALRASAFVKKRDGSAPRLDEVALAVNSRFTRTQDQLHIHIGCASPRVREALPALAASMKVGEWVRVHSLVPGSERDGTCAFARLLFPKLDEASAIEFRDPQPAQSALEESEARSLRSSDGFAHLLKVLAMQLDQIAERLRVAGASRQGGLAPVDASLDLKRPFLGVLSAKECLVDIFSFPWRLGSPGP